MAESVDEILKTIRERQLAYDLGFQAGAAVRAHPDQPPASCPYRQGTAAFNRWLKGFEDASSELAWA